MLRFALVAMTLALSLLPADLALSQNTFPLAQRTPTPPSDPGELHAWCKSHVYRSRGERRENYGRVVWHIGDANYANRITDSCVRGKGRMFRGVVYPEQKQAARTIRPVSPDHAAALKLAAGPPPSGGDALVKWCNMKTFGRHGRRMPEHGPGIYMPMELQAATQDACIRSKGRSF